MTDYLDTIPMPLYAGNKDVYSGDGRFYAGYSGLTSWSDATVSTTSWSDV